MEYRENDYFNDQDHYVVETNLNKLLVTRLHLDRGIWYTNAGMQYKATSVRMTKTSEVIRGSLVELNGAKGIVGQLSLEPSYVGVNWLQGQKHNNYFWNDINKLNKIK